MNHKVSSLACLMAFIAVLGMGLALMRAASEFAFEAAFTGTFFLLLAATIAARHRGPFWYGFAVVGWGYFLIGAGPWFGAAPVGSQGELRLNLSTITGFLLDQTVRSCYPDPRSPEGRHLRKELTYALSIGHMILAFTFAVIGGLCVRFFENRRRSEGPRSFSFVLATAIATIAFAGLVGATTNPYHGFRVFYTATIFALLAAWIAARDGRPFWHGFAVAGWAYFLLGAGPWFVRVYDPIETYPNPAFLFFGGWDRCQLRLFKFLVPDPTPGIGHWIGHHPFGPDAYLFFRWTVMGMTHCILTFAIAALGGWLAVVLARRHSKVNGAAADATLPKDSGQ